MLLEIRDWISCTWCRLFYCRVKGHRPKFSINYCLRCRTILRPEKPL